MSFVQRKIDVTIKLGTGAFGDTGSDTVKMTGKRVSAQIIKGALPSFDSAVIRIFGVTQSVMNTVSRLGKPLTLTRNNTVTLTVGDDTDGMGQVFVGTIMSAYPDFSGLPDVALVLNANAGAVDLARPVPALSFPNGADAAVIASQIAASMNKSFVNKGVSVHLPSFYCPGTALDQLRVLTETGNFWADSNTGKYGRLLEIWPKNTERATVAEKLSAQSGLIGYPQYCDYGVSLTALYRPGYLIGAQFELESDFVGANGRWNVMQLSYDLESETPDGAWFMNIGAYLPTSGAGVR